MHPLAALFPSGTGYLAACTGGLPARPTLDALRADLDAWESGVVSPAEYGRVADDCRAAFARIVGVPVDDIAIGSQVSAQVSVIAAAAPDGAEILCAEGEFSSVVAPFAAYGLRVRAVPLAALADSLTDQTWLVAYSLVQSATGEVASPRIAPVARAAGVRTLVDLTQAAGVLPVDASLYDATVTHAYKWLCCPRGVSFLTLSPAFAAALVPIQAGWYAGQDVWASCYGSRFELASSARRFDVSPAWQAVVGAAPALELFASTSAQASWEHATALGDALCDGLGIGRQGQAIVTWPDQSGDDLVRLTEAGLTVSGRAGRVRVAFHVWNDGADVEAVLRAVGR
ncbi:selenocysteine lyase/cysteine desulfurase [Frondihabitans sp. PhB188]|uniref:aminotransferase class V-fold PLP-dependent enzyme n=1 Tax=Frondihabitans sp. PhB188 TaxID=2485200 RepID=UPI000F468181|nr:aminotransferase class V-fold PLP-dependent enzyme [Frondihabitans sp. PhB188]ROQ41186.1 selenocysteine lyase/cysteine desulfurase [Frondihabitans sp. PhB188]